MSDCVYAILSCHKSKDDIHCTGTVMCLLFYMLLPTSLYANNSQHKKKTTFISGMEWVSLRSLQSRIYTYLVLRTRHFQLSDTSSIPTMYIDFSQSLSMLTLRGRGKMTAVSQMALPSAFSWPEMLWFLLTGVSLKFVPKDPIHNIAGLVLIMASHWPGDKPLFQQIMARLPTHICITQPQCVNNDDPTHG